MDFFATYPEVLGTFRDKQSDSFIIEKPNFSKPNFYKHKRQYMSY